MVAGIVILMVVVIGAYLFINSSKNKTMPDVEILDGKLPDMENLVKKIYPQPGGTLVDVGDRLMLQQLGFRADPQRKTYHMIQQFELQDDARLDEGLYIARHGTTKVDGTNALILKTNMYKNVDLSRYVGSTNYRIFRKAVQGQNMQANLGKFCYLIQGEGHAPIYVPVNGKAVRVSRIVISETGTMYYPAESGGKAMYRQTGWFFLSKQAMRAVQIHNTDMDEFAHGEVIE